MYTPVWIKYLSLHSLVSLGNSHRHAIKWLCAIMNHAWFYMYTYDQKDAA